MSVYLLTYFSLLTISAEKFAKKLLGESEVEAVLQRLDRLTQEEARMTAAHTLEVVHRLVNNVKLVMDGTHSLLGYLHGHVLKHRRVRWKGINK